MKVGAIERSRSLLFNKYRFLERNISLLYRKCCAYFFAYIFADLYSLNKNKTICTMPYEADYVAIVEDDRAFSGPGELRGTRGRVTRRNSKDFQKVDFWSQKHDFHDFFIIFDVLYRFCYALCSTRSVVSRS